MYKKISYCIVGIIIILMLMHPVLAGSMGFGPVEITGSNKRDTQIIGTASLINNYDTAKYAVFKLKIPYINENTWQPIPSEQNYIRVICRDCGKEMQRYEAIPGYSYPDSMLEGSCEICGSHNLIFYELMPRDEFYGLSLEGAGKFELREEEEFVYMTTEKIPPGETCNINLLYNASQSYIKENEDKFWEARLSATLRDEVTEEGFGVVAGIGIRLLIEFKFPLFIEVDDIISKGEEFQVKVTYGDPQNTWREIPTDVQVSFNGETKTIDEKGIVAFTVPDTRRDFNYEIKAEGNKYLTDTKTVATEAVAGAVNQGENTIIDTVFIIGLSFCIIALLSLVIYFLSQKKQQRKSLETLPSQKQSSKSWSPIYLSRKKESVFSDENNDSHERTLTPQPDSSVTVLGNPHDIIHKESITMDDKTIHAQNTEKSEKDQDSEIVSSDEIRKDIGLEIDRLVKSQKK